MGHAAPSPPKAPKMSRKQRKALRAEVKRCREGGASCRHCKPYEDPLGEVPGWRITSVKQQFLADPDLEGADFERMLDEALKPCEHCGSHTHVGKACGLVQGESLIPDDAAINMVYASAEAIPGRSSASVIPSGMAAADYGRQLFAAALTEPGVHPEVRRFAGLTADEYVAEGFPNLFKRQTQVGGDGSVNIQAGGDVSLPPAPPRHDAGRDHLTVIYGHPRPVYELGNPRPVAYEPLPLEEGY